MPYRCSGQLSCSILAQGCPQASAHSCLPCLYACRVLIGGQEGTLALLEGGTVTWKREEALSAIQEVLFVDLPAPSAELAANQSSAGPTLVERFQVELLAAKVCKCPWRSVQHVHGMCPTLRSARPAAVASQQVNSCMDLPS